MTTSQQIGPTRLDLLLGDITTQVVDAIVNAANSRLAGGGGVDGAIHRAGGPAIMEECRRIGHCPTGQAVATTGGLLAVKKVIHTVGPIYSGAPADAALLADCYRNSLALAARLSLRTVAFASISTGVYGYPVDDAAKIAIATVRQSVRANPAAFDEVRFVLFNERVLAAFAAALAG
ncbi:Appr-1-p processing domain protein [Desulfarculus baarsii DSM 2075]|uniref:Appr-1-p processing domain protein n=1 Tax=Desulfarculus baarsii (strain ATCC 33931 / DSM 2075 / LMG 7858 / VKM B-1802 / 2st14) TaxID=644282 RepID=E1QKA1_DESB2|nr:O-acetyl-ADP-ribose deacetylase [Desulfarculus baarsii]ADK85994.1 Appr-1-p processing domain protein [Desulfarculus baarsii DSM 2075]